MATQMVTVTCTPNDDETITIKPDPFQIPLAVGDSAIWLVSGLQSGFKVIFDFDIDNDAPNGVFGNLGPKVERTSDGSEIEIDGDSFNPPNLSQLDYHYGILVLNSAGDQVGNKDPQIDNLGQPPGTMTDDGDGS